MILIITVNYNNAKLTNETIKSIYKCEKNVSFVKVVIVDNNSQDKEQLIENENIKIIKLDNNLGYFPAINIAIKQTDLSLYDYVIICNNDLKFENNFFDQLSSSNYEKNVYAICPRILDLDNIDQNPMLDKGISKFKVFFYDIYYKNYYFGQVLYKLWQKIKPKKHQINLEPRQIFMGYGAIYVLTKNFFTNNKTLETPPFLMFEETFLAYQIFTSNGIELFDPSLIVHHQDHSTCSKVPKKKMYKICKESYKYFRKKIFKLPKLK